MYLLHCKSASDLKENLKSVEESIEKCKNVLKEMDFKLGILKQEKAYLSEDLEEVEKSHIKMMQTLEHSSLNQEVLGRTDLKID